VLSAKPIRRPTCDRGKRTFRRTSIPALVATHRATPDHAARRGSGILAGATGGVGVGALLGALVDGLVGSCMADP